MNGYILQRDYRGKVISYETQKLLRTAEDIGLNLTLKDPSAFQVVVDPADRKRVMLDGREIVIPDLIFPRMGATTSYQALALIRHFEHLGVYSVNSSRSIEMAKDKLFQMQILSEHLVPIPKTILAQYPLSMDLIESKLGFPVVIKTLSGSQGSGVYLSESKSNFLDFMGMMQNTHGRNEMILQEYIESSRGKDLRVYVLGDRVLGAMQRSSNDDSFKANFSRGGSVSTFSLSPEMEEMCIRIAKIFQMDIAGIDLLFDQQGKFKICEVNSSPGFKGMEMATGKNIAKEILYFIWKKAKK